MPDNSLIIDLQILSSWQHILLSFSLFICLKIFCCVCRLAIERYVNFFNSFNNWKTCQVLGRNCLVSPRSNLFILVYFYASLILLLFWFYSFMNHDRPHLLAIQDPMVKYLSILFHLT